MANHLKSETSPYLLQHADNPVDWYPWGEEAFERAKAENKPVFLSIGYSTCHWCHVMAEESFEDAEIASVLNQSFVSVKVDREERPDIDVVYMTVCQMMNGSGGWPLTVFMTPDKKPFFSGTYFPPRTQYGRIGLLDLLRRTDELWNDKHGNLSDFAETIVFQMNASSAEITAAAPSAALVRQGYDELSKSFDTQWGGFSDAPKFPMPQNLSFLLEYAALENDAALSAPALLTLTRMAQGGIFDHIGGGFSRYSTDRAWLVPHFEKMLYDNALLISAYLKAWKSSGDSLFRSTAERTADYVLRELTSPSGAFYCAQDADSDGREGKYYLFTADEIIQVLGKKDAKTFCERFNITEKGNFEEKNIPNRIHSGSSEDLSGADTAAIDHFGADAPLRNASSINKAALHDIGENAAVSDGSATGEMIQKIYDYRRSRTELHRDEKILVSWNGLMITALAEAAAALSRPDYLEAAKKADRFILDHMTDGDGRLHTAFAGGKVSAAGCLDDYAFYACALLSLYETTGDISLLLRAQQLAEQIITRFADEEAGGFFLTASDAEQLIQRPKETSDGALPSGNAAAGRLFAKLAAMTGKEIWRTRRDRQLSFLAGAAQRYAAAHCAALEAMLCVLYPSAELLCVTSEESTGSKEILRLRSELKLPPNTTLLFKNSGNQKQLEAAAPFTADYPLPQSGTQYYLCRDNACMAPFSDLKELKAYLTDQHI